MCDEIVTSQIFNEASIASFKIFANEKSMQQKKPPKGPENQSATGLDIGSWTQSVIEKQNSTSTPVQPFNFRREALVTYHSMVLPRRRPRGSSWFGRT